VKKKNRRRLPPAYFFWEKSVKRIDNYTPMGYNKDVRRGKEVALEDYNKHRNQENHQNEEKPSTENHGTEQSPKNQNYNNTYITKCQGPS
jgi:hypothetical protein